MKRLILALLICGGLAVVPDARATVPVPPVCPPGGPVSAPPEQASPPVIPANPPVSPPTASGTPPVATTPAPPPPPPACDCRTCESRRVITIRIRERQPLASAYAVVNGRRVNARRTGGRLRVTFSFRGRRYQQDQVETIAIVARPSSGGTVAATRSYRPCRPVLGRLNRPIVL